MRLLFLLAAMTLAAWMPVFASDSPGQVVFYSYPNNPVNNQDKEDQGDVDDDFSYHVGNILDDLKKHNIKYQIVETNNFAIKSGSGLVIKIVKKQIPVTTGYVMVKNNGKYLIRNGIGTDIDMLLDIYEYFGIKQ